MQAENFAAYGQPQSGAPFFAGTGFIHHVKRFCDFGELLLLHPAAVIDDQNLIAVITSAAQQRDLSLLPLIDGFTGVIQQIDADCGHQIRLYGQQRILTLYGKSNVILLHDGQNGLVDGLKKLFAGNAAHRQVFTL